MGNVIVKIVVGLCARPLSDIASLRRTARQSRLPRAVIATAVDSFQSGVIKTAKVILMNSSFRSSAARELRTFSATSADPRCSTQRVSSMMAASRASWFSLILKSREGSRSEFGIGFLLGRNQSSRGIQCRQNAGEGQSAGLCRVGIMPASQCPIGFQSLREI